jgi:hypothetical protein
MPKWISPTAWGFGAVGVGASLILASFTFVAAGQEDDWRANALLTIGAAVLLIAPIAIVSSKLTSKITQVRDEVIDDVEEFKGEIDRTLDDIAHAVAEQLQTDRDAHQAAFQWLRESPTRAVTLEAIERARALGVIDDRTRHPRVPITEDGPLYLAFWGQKVALESPTGPTRPGEVVALEVERADGALVERLTWGERESTTGIMVRVGHIVEQTTGEKDVNVEGIFNGLADLLDVGNSHPKRRPAIELCPPQWVVTTRGITRYGDGRPPIDFSVQRLRDDQELTGWIQSRQWADIESFEEARDHADDLLKR